jgi:hypothetical protein
MQNMTTSLKITGIGIGIIQLIDVMIHAATGQLEPIRVASNISILLWLAMIVSGRLKEKSLLMAVLSIVVYLILNFIFLALEGVTNAAQGGELRVALFLLMFCTVALSGLFTYMNEKFWKIPA